MQNETPKVRDENEKMPVENSLVQDGMIKLQDENLEAIDGSERALPPAHGLRQFASRELLPFNGLNFDCGEMLFSVCVMKHEKCMMKLQKCRMRMKKCTLKLHLCVMNPPNCKKKNIKAQSPFNLLHTKTRKRPLPGWITLFY